MLIKGTYYASPFADILEVENCITAHPPLLTHSKKEAGIMMVQGEALRDNNSKAYGQLNMSEQTTKSSPVNSTESSYDVYANHAELVETTVTEKEGMHSNSLANGHLIMSEQITNSPPVSNMVIAELSYDVYANPAESMTGKEAMQQVESSMIEQEGMQQALTKTLKLMQMKLAMPSDKAVSNPPHTSLDVTDNIVAVEERNLQMPTLNTPADVIVESESQVLHGGHEEINSIVAVDLQPNHNIHEHTFTAPKPSGLVHLNQDDTTGGSSQGQNNNINVAKDIDAFLDSIVMPIQQPIIQEDYHMAQPPEASTSNDIGHLQPEFCQTKER
jgi:hypothetical protein